MSQIVVDFDKKDPKTGLWLRYWVDKSIGQCCSLSSSRWGRIQARVRSSAIHKNSPTYLGVINNFESFQEFVDWSIGEYGYKEREVNGNYWAIDKDLLGDGRTYCKDYCIFMPQEVNSFLTFRQHHRGIYPLGVSFHKKAGKFSAQCSGYGMSVRGHIGLYSSEYEAHRAWQQAKSGIAKQFAVKFKRHEKLSGGLVMFAERLDNDLYQGKETIYV